MTKIALIGNMNNNFFALCRHLRNRGYIADLFFRPAADHFHPKADTTILEELAYCREINWFNINSPDERIDQIQQDLKGYDFFIGSGDEAALAAEAGVRFDIYCPYGSDIYKYAHLPHKYPWHVHLRSLLRSPSLPDYRTVLRGTRSKYLYKAIKTARHIVWDHANPEIDKKLYDINPEGTIHTLPLPFVYTSYLESEKGSVDVHWYSYFQQLRSSYDFLVLYHGRHEWKNSLNYKNNEFTTKNTHYLLMGFAQFVSEQPSSRAKLITIEYGGDIQASKDLIVKLGIQDHVIWFPKMFRKDIYRLIEHVDICCGEFYKSYVTFGTIVEGMIMGKPIIHFRDNNLYCNVYDWLYPLYNSKQPEEIAHSLTQAYKHPTERISIGKQAKAWVEKYVIERPLSLFESLINGCI